MNSFQVVTCITVPYVANKTPFYTKNYISSNNGKLTVE